MICMDGKKDLVIVPTLNKKCDSIFPSAVQETKNNQMIVCVVVCSDLLFLYSRLFFNITI